MTSRRSPLHGCSSLFSSHETNVRSSLDFHISPQYQKRNGRLYSTWYGNMTLTLDLGCFVNNFVKIFQGPVLAGTVIFITSQILKALSPKFGKLVADQVNRLLALYSLAIHS